MGTQMSRDILWFVVALVLVAIPFALGIW